MAPSPSPSPSPTSMTYGMTPAEKARRKKKQVAYLLKHRGQLERVAQRCVNMLLHDLPADPYEGLLAQLSDYTKAGVLFSRLRVWPAGPETVFCEVLAEARGTPVSALREELSCAMVEKGLLAISGAEQEEGAETAPSHEVAARLTASLRGAVSGVEVLKFGEALGSLDSALGTTAALAAGPLAPEAATLRSKLAAMVLRGAGRLQGNTGHGMQAVRSGMSQANLEASWPIACQADLEEWCYCWPEILAPGLQGASAKRRLCVGTTLWAALLEDAQTVGAGEPEWVDEAAKRKRLQAADEAHADMELDEDEVPEPDPDEWCPPLNAVAIASAVGAAVAAKVCAETPSFPAGEDFMAALDLFRSALEAVAPKYAETEPRPKPPAEEGEGAEDAESEEEKNGDEDDEDEPKHYIPLDVTQKKGCLYCALHMDADAAFDPESGGYKFDEGSEAEPRTWSQLVEYYEELCKAEPLLRLIVAPFSTRDPGHAEGLEKLRSVLPAGVSVVADSAEPEPAPPAPATPEAEDEETVLCKVGHVRDLGQTALGLAAQCFVCYSHFFDRVGLYDYGMSPEYLPAAVSYLDVSLALPEVRRFLLLPKSGGGEELQEMIEPLMSRLRGLQIQSYRQTKPGEGGKSRTKDLSFKPFREGLRKLGYEDADKYAEPIFNFLDLSKNGSISPKELCVIEHVNGPASLQEIDDFRLWLCEWFQNRKRRAEKRSSRPGTSASRPRTAAESEASLRTTGSIGIQTDNPMQDLMLRMDDNASGMVSFGEFKRALRKMKFPCEASNDGKLHELFMSLDVSNDGTITQDEFNTLNILSARYQLERVSRVNHYLHNQFGSLKATFKAMDEDRSGNISKEEWVANMRDQHGYEPLEDLNSCFYFVDKDSSGVLTSKEFEFLGQFSEDQFLSELQTLHDKLIEKYETLENAYDAFEKAGEHGVGGGLTPKDFLNGCRQLGILGVYDPRLLFNFVDAMHAGKVCKQEFVQMGNLGSIIELKEASAKMRAALTSFKAFAYKDAAADASHEEVLTTLHEDLLKATEFDLF